MDNCIRMQYMYGERKEGRMDEYYIFVYSSILLSSLNLTN